MGFEFQWSDKSHYHAQQVVGKKKKGIAEIEQDNFYIIEGNSR